MACAGTMDESPFTWQTLPSQTGGTGQIFGCSGSGSGAHPGGSSPVMGSNSHSSRANALLGVIAIIAATTAAIVSNKIMRSTIANLPFLVINAVSGRAPLLVSAEQIRRSIRSVVWYLWLVRFCNEVALGRSLNTWFAEALIRWRDFFSERVACRDSHHRHQNQSYRDQHSYALHYLPILSRKSRDLRDLGSSILYTLLLLDAERNHMRAPGSGVW